MQVAISTELSVSVASQIRIEIRTEVLFNLHFRSTVNAKREFPSDVPRDSSYTRHDKRQIKFLKESVTHGVSRNSCPTLDQKPA